MASGCEEDDFTETGVANSALTSGADVEPSASEAAAELVAKPYIHPLNGMKKYGEETALSTTPDAIPAVNVFDSPTGKRYAEMETMTIDPETGAPIVESGIAELTVTRDPKIGPAVEPDTTVPPEKKITAALRKKFEESDGAAVPVIISLVRKEEPITHLLDKAIALGEIETYQDYEEVRQEILSARAAQIAELQKPVIEELSKMEVKNISSCGGFHCVSAYLTTEQIEKVAQLASVQFLDDGNPPYGLDFLDGWESLHGHQIAQFVEATHGATGTFPYQGQGIYAGQYEGKPDIRSLGFLNNFGGNRRISCRFCSSSPDTCASCDNDTTGFEHHATGVAYIAIGDLRDGQDQSIIGYDNRVNRSGLAPEGYLYSYNANPSTGPGAYVAWSDLVSRSPAPSVLNVSMNFGLLNCNSNTVSVSKFNEVFENGVLPIKSAGNNRTSDPDGCTLNQPAPAIGAFVVGSHGNYEDCVDPLPNPADPTDEDDVRNDSISDYSSRGGVSWAEGANRTIVDITTHGSDHRTYFEGVNIPCPDGVPNQFYDAQFGGTSASTPIVTGAAMDLVGWYRANVSAGLNTPGALHSMMLMMGDRQSQNGSKLSTGFDNLYGAGRLKMRRWDDYGMGNWKTWGRSSFCIGQGEVVEVDLYNLQTTPDSADDVEAVIWWYDRRHETGAQIDNIDLQLVRVWPGTPPGVSLLVQSNNQYEEKERVYYHYAGGKSLRLRIVGTNVTADDEGCGANRNKVYFSVHVEDTSRDDAEGPCTPFAAGCPNAANDYWGIDPM